MVVDPKEIVWEGKDYRIIINRAGRRHCQSKETGRYVAMEKCELAREKARKEEVEEKRREARIAPRRPPRRPRARPPRREGVIPRETARQLDMLDELPPRQIMEELEWLEEAFPEPRYIIY